MLKIQEEIGLRDTAFYREAFEEGELEGRLAAFPLLRELGLSDEAIANKLDVTLTDVRRIPKRDKRENSR